MLLTQVEFLIGGVTFCTSINYDLHPHFSEFQNCPYKYPKKEVTMHYLKLTYIKLCIAMN